MSMMTAYFYTIEHNGLPCYVGATNDMHLRWTAHRNSHNNPKATNYKTPISKFMRAKGFKNFQHVLLESLEVEDREERDKYEGSWYQVLGAHFELCNQYVPGNGYNGRGSISYDNMQRSLKTRVPCEICGKIYVYGYMFSHRKTHLPPKIKPKIKPTIIIRPPKIKPTIRIRVPLHDR